MSTFKLIKDSCVDQEVDAIVNAANKYLLAGSGVCGAIFNKAGYEELQKECNDAIKAPLNDGEAVITSSCNLTNCLHIIHAVGPNFSITPDSFEELINAYYNSLELLYKNNLHSISFPLISSGIYGGNLSNPVRESTKSCIKAYEKFKILHPEYDISLLLCCFTDKEYIEAEKVCRELNVIEEITLKK